MKMAAKMAIASTKFAIGLEHEAVFLFGFGQSSSCRSVRNACSILVPEKFHIATERDGGNLPARAVTVIESGDLRAETNRKRQHLDAAPTRHQKVTKLVKENDDRQHKQKRHDIADEAPAERAQASDDFHTH
jgi:hypothetical protein